MGIFGIITDNNMSATLFIEETRKRLANSNLIKNPFIGKIKTFELDNNLLLHIVSMKPIYFNFTIFGWIIAASIFFIWGLNWFILPGILLGCVGIFWSKYFYRWLFIKGLKRAGYNGVIKKIDNTQVIEQMVDEEFLKGG